MKEPYNNCLCIDTGVNTGWAFFTKDNKIPETGLICIKKEYRKTVEQYIINMGKLFISLLDIYNPSKIYIEHPEFWNNSKKSETSVKSGALLHLASNAYSYAGICGILGKDFTLLTAKQWKGTMNDDAVEYRVKKILGKHFNNSHINDAVGIGLSRDLDLWQLRKFLGIKKEKR